MTPQDDSIVAIATAQGRGAIAVVRLSGRDAHAIARRCLSRWPEQARTAMLAEMRSQDDGSWIDRVVVTRYDAPHSYTGEPMVEVSGHGGLLSPVAVAAALVRAGARPAEPGEFTRRAVLNGKLDLLQAEGIGAIIDAATETSRRYSLHQVEGGLSRAVASLRESLLQLEALLVYEIDFPEEDDGPVAPVRIRDALERPLQQLRRLLATIPLGEIVRNGATVVLAGRPNAGKSSLFNALLGVERAIVHASPGTTRDAIEAMVQAGQWPMRIVDTAGLRESVDEIERTGVEISHRYVSSAHLVLVCGATAAELTEAMAAVQQVSSAPVIPIHTKADLPAGSPADWPPEALSVSVRTRLGLADLLSMIEKRLSTEYGSLDPEVPLLSRERHRTNLEEALAELEAFGSARASGTVPTSIAAVHIRTALHRLETMIGTVDVEEVLSAVFSTFCVGK